MPYVLLVEPYDDLRLFLSLYLARRGYRAESASSAMQAMAFARDEPPRALVFEVNVAASAVDFVEQVRALSHPELCVVAMSNGWYEDEAVAKAVGLTMLRKPFDPRRVVQELVRAAVPMSPKS